MGKTGQTVWGKRWNELSDAGLTREQALAVHHIIDECRGFHTQSLADGAMDALNVVWPPPVGGEYPTPVSVANQLYEVAAVLEDRGFDDPLVVKIRDQAARLVEYDQTVLGG